MTHYVVFDLDSLGSLSGPAWVLGTHHSVFRPIDAGWFKNISAAVVAHDRLNHQAQKIRFSVETVDEAEARFERLPLEAKQRAAQTEAMKLFPDLQQGDGSLQHLNPLQPSLPVTRYDRIMAAGGISYEDVMDNLKKVPEGWIQDTITGAYASQDMLVLIDAGFDIGTSSGDINVVPKIVKRNELQMRNLQQAQALMKAVPSIFGFKHAPGTLARAEAAPRDIRAEAFCQAIAMADVEINELREKAQNQNIFDGKRAEYRASMKAMEAFKAKLQAKRDSWNAAS